MSAPQDVQLYIGGQCIGPAIIKRFDIHQVAPKGTRLIPLSTTISLDSFKRDPGWFDFLMPMLAKARRARKGLFRRRQAIGTQAFRREHP